MWSSMASGIENPVAAGTPMNSVEIGQARDKILLFSLKGNFKVIIQFLLYILRTTPLI